MKSATTPFTQLHRMSLALFTELERLVGKEHMKNLCQDYLEKHSASASVSASATASATAISDASGSRMWKDCSGEDMGVYPKSWIPAPRLKTPPKIHRTILRNTELS